MQPQLNPITARTLRNLGINLAEFWRHIRRGKDDFILRICSATDEPEYRFINQAVIDDILEDDLASDDYLLGSFTPQFLAEVTGLPSSVFTALQRDGHYEEISAIVKAFDCVAKVKNTYIGYDGYGHHFAPYDGAEVELVINPNLTYYMFRVN